MISETNAILNGHVLNGLQIV